METRRQQKVANVLKMDLATLFQRESKSLFGGAFITVTVVRVTPDLSYAKVYLSILGSDQKKVLKMVQDQAKDIRKYVGQRVRHQLRITPEMAFFIDDSLDYYEEIDKILKE